MAEPKIVQKSPFIRDTKPGKYYWCACGLSANQPFCDGSHKTTDIKPVAVAIEEEKKLLGAVANIPAVNRTAMVHTEIYEIILMK